MLFDLRDAVRCLVRDRGYSITVVLTLALTIGAATAVFSIVDGVLLQPLAYAESHRLVVIREFVHQLSRIAPSFPVNPRHFYEWRQRVTSFDHLAQFNVVTMNMTNAGDPAQVVVVPTTARLFEALGAAPLVGRSLVADDERLDGEPVV